MKLILIRHGATKGNLEKRYIGRTDEELCPEGIALLMRKEYPAADMICCSPQKRCVQTANIIYPAREITCVDAFRECDFGVFEGKNYQDLTGNADYQRWIDSGGRMEFPGGEDPAGFRRRCAEAFEKLTAEEMPEAAESLALVVHGGTIMSILERYEASNVFYRWQCGNGCGFTGEWQRGEIIVTGVI